MSTRSILLSTLCFAALAAGCPSSDPAEPVAPQPAEEGSAPTAAPDALAEDPNAPVLVRIRQDGLRIAPGGAPTQLSAIVFNAAGEELSVPVQWHSLDPQKVTVDALGRLSALGPLGPAFVTASAGDVLAERQLPVYVVRASELPAVEEGSGEDEAGEDEAGDSGVEGSDGAETE